MSDYPIGSYTSQGEGCFQWTHRNVRCPDSTSSFANSPVVLQRSVYRSYTIANGIGPVVGQFVPIPTIPLRKVNYYIGGSLAQHGQWRWIFCEPTQCYSCGITYRCLTRFEYTDLCSNGIARPPFPQSTDPIGFVFGEDQEN